MTEANLRASSGSASVEHLNTLPSRTSHDATQTRTRASLDAYASYYDCRDDAPLLPIASVSPPRHSNERQSGSTTTPERKRKKRQRAVTVANDDPALFELRRQLQGAEEPLESAVKSGVAPDREEQDAQARRKPRREDREERASRRRRERAASLERMHAIEEAEGRERTRTASHATTELAISPPSTGAKAAAALSDPSKHDGAELRRVEALEAEVERLRRELEEARTLAQHRTAQRADEDQVPSHHMRHVHFAPTPPLSDIDMSATLTPTIGDSSFLSISSSNSSSLSSSGVASLFSGFPHPPALVPHRPAPAPPLVPVPPPAPPPPAALAPSERMTPLALLAAARRSHPPLSRAATDRVAGSERKGAASPLGADVDMGKFLSEMKSARLRKVGLPLEGAAKRDKERDRDKEGDEGGIRGVLEGVLRRRLQGSSSTAGRDSASTAASSSLRSRKTGKDSGLDSSSSSITSFSSYRPPDWSMDLATSCDRDAAISADPGTDAVLPPPRTSSLGVRPAAREGQWTPIQAGTWLPTHGHSASTSSLPVSVQRPVASLPSSIKQSRTLSHSQAASFSSQIVHTPSHQTNARSSGGGSRRSITQPGHVSLLSKPHARPSAAFGHALSTDAPPIPAQQACRLPAKRYAVPHGHRATGSSSSTPAPASTQAMRDLPEPPSTGLTQRTRKTSNESDASLPAADNERGASVRSAGSSFDIDMYMYAQMQLHAGPVSRSVDISAQPGDAQGSTAASVSIVSDASFDIEAEMEQERLELSPPEEQVRGGTTRPMLGRRIPTLRFSNTPLLPLLKEANMSSEGDAEQGRETRSAPLQTRAANQSSPGEGKPVPTRSKRAPDSSSSVRIWGDLSRSLGKRRRSNEENVEVGQLEITEEDADMLLDGEESFLAAYGER